MGACDSCPDYIKAAARRPVAQALAQVRAIKGLTSSLNNSLTRTSTSAVTAIVSDLDAIVDVIPDAPALGPGDIIGLLTCPLLPWVIGLDLAQVTNMDPKVILDRVKVQMRKFIDEIVENYENALRDLQDFTIVNGFKRFLEDVKRLRFDADVLAATAATTAYVNSVCSTEYSAGPYEAFDAEVSGWSMSGLVPSGVDPLVQPILDKLQEAETKFVAWRALVVST